MRYKPKSSDNNTALVHVWGIEFVVQFDYSPAEPMTWWEPGCAEQYDIWEIKPATIADGVEMIEQCITEADLASPRFLELVELELAEQHQSYQRDYHSDY